MSTSRPPPWPTRSRARCFAKSVLNLDGGLADVFVTKLNADGSGLGYSTYLGGSAADEGKGIAVDDAGNTYVTGSTYSVNFPTANPFQAALSTIEGRGQDAFITKFNASSAALVYSTYLGGSGGDLGNAN